MNRTQSLLNEKAASEAFGKQAPLFDTYFGVNTIIQYKRKRVRDHVNKIIPPHSSILELNAGTGEDAIYFAGLGHSVHATDSAQGMQDVLNEKVAHSGLQHLVTSERCSFTQLENLQQQGPYDLVFSNFAGLNCTNQLNEVLQSFTYLLKPGGWVTLVLLPRFCLWEFLLIFKGKFKTAFRRFTGKKGTAAKIEGTHFRCWYYNPSFIRKKMREEYTVVSLEGLCTLVPPSYIEHFPEKYPRGYRALEKKEQQWKNKWPWNRIGDYFIITLQKNT